MAPIWAFQAQTSIRTSGLSAQPGPVPGRSTCVLEDVPDDGEPLMGGRSAFAGTTASFTLAAGASFSKRPPPDRCDSLQTPVTTPTTRRRRTTFPVVVRRMVHASLSIVTIGTRPGNGPRSEMSHGG